MPPLIYELRKSYFIIISSIKTRHPFQVVLDQVCHHLMGYCGIFVHWWNVKCADLMWNQVGRSFVFIMSKDKHKNSTASHLSWFFSSMLQQSGKIWSYLRRHFNPMSFVNIESLFSSLPPARSFECHAARKVDFYLQFHDWICLLAFAYWLAPAFEPIGEDGAV